MANSVDPDDEMAHLDLQCMDTKVSALVCRDERVKD